MQKRNYRRTSGFTLIELSIVLVIIGLIVGGILVGKDLIAAAKTRRQITQIASYEVAARTFALKYNCMAGDCPNATQFFGTLDGGNPIANGDGDGIIRSATGFGGTIADTSDCLSGELSSEVSQFFLHLGLAGFSEFKGNGGSGAPDKLGVGRSIATTDYDRIRGLFVSCLNNGSSPTGGMSSRWRGQFNVMILGGALGVGGTLNNTATYRRIRYYIAGQGSLADWAGGLPISLLYALDTKLDDGFPSTGNVGPLYICDGTAANASFATYQEMDQDCVASLGKLYQNGGP